MANETTVQSNFVKTNERLGVPRLGSPLPTKNYLGEKELDTAIVARVKRNCPAIHFARE